MYQGLLTNWTLSNPLKWDVSMGYRNLPSSNRSHGWESENSPNSKTAVS